MPETIQQFNAILKRIENGDHNTNQVMIDCEVYKYQGVSGIVISNYHIDLLVNALKQKTHITLLYLTCTNITDQGINVILGLDQLTTLHLIDSETTIKGVISMANSKLINLRLGGILNIQDNDVLSEDQDELLDAFCRNERIQTLFLHFCKVNDRFVSQLISKNNTIRELSIDNSKLTDKSLQSITQNKVLSSLYLPQNNFTDIGLSLILQNENIINVNFVNNNLTKNGLEQVLGSHLQFFLGNYKNMSTSDYFKFQIEFDKFKHLRQNNHIGIQQNNQ